MSSVSTPSLKSVPFFVGEFHRARKPAPMNRFLVHSHSSDDEQRQYAKSQVCTTLRRRVPPCTEISAAEPFSRPRVSLRTAADGCMSLRVSPAKRKVWPRAVVELARKTFSPLRRRHRDRTHENTDSDSVDDSPSASRAFIHPSAANGLSR
ncbi:hypothetical protein EVAR_77120_1 [Eumeta japonica]|uniref:Uncharacterized protein n=1 Tax=Eumeta variegata TaxID=151549 RepID=A0A4C1T4M7_EUMVA|nr:hypothetical protein EVAR_77120_1 [Eumeta japonica]